MRIVFAKSSAVSFVSPVRMLRVPRPGEIGFGLSNAEYKLVSPLSSSTDLSLESSSLLHSLVNSSFIVKVTIPLIIGLIIVVVITSIVCCFRGQVVKRPLRLTPDRQTYTAVGEQSSCASPLYSVSYGDNRSSGSGLRLHKLSSDENSIGKSIMQTGDQTFQKHYANPRHRKIKTSVTCEC